MSININEIAQKKIDEMETSGEIKNHIESKLHSLVLDSVASAFNGYGIRKKIQEMVESQISPCLDTLDFTGYNSFICEKLKQITEEYLKEDIAKKVSDTFEDIFMLKYESIKLSEIFEAYRDWQIEDLEESEKYELNNEFYTSMNESEHGFLYCSISKEEPSNSLTYFGDKRKDIFTCDFGFSIFRNLDKPGWGRLSRVYFEGQRVTEMVKITSYNKFQTLLLNLYYNETPIVLDVEDECDIDTSLGLDI